ncbi:MAG: NAD(P)(+) transhydrogenase (Re/Si-specific) subunit beta [Polyangia bacterium]
MTSALGEYGVPFLDMAAAVAFIMGLKLMCRVRTARRSVLLLSLGFVLALAGMAIEASSAGSFNIGLALAGLAGGVLLGVSLGYFTKVGPGASVGPWLAAAGGGGAVLLGVAAFLREQSWPWASQLALAEGWRGAAVGLAVFAGSAALVLGALAAVGPAARSAGRAAVVALAASAAGLAAAMMGFAFGDPVVVTVGGLSASAGWSLAQLVARALGARPLDLALGTAGRREGDAYLEVKACGAEEAAMVLESASKVILVPGYGMAVAQAQHALAETAKAVRARGAQVLYAVHPAAGLIPGHMNILLDEAKVDLAEIVDWERANRELADADVALVVGGNDIVNPAAQGDPESAVFGMPFIDVGRAATVFVVKRTLGPGAAGVKNPLFERPNTNMIFGDAKKVLQAIGLELKAAGKVAARAPVKEAA